MSAKVKLEFKQTLLSIHTKHRYQRFFFLDFNIFFKGALNNYQPSYFNHHNYKQ